MQFRNLFVKDPNITTAFKSEDKFLRSNFMYPFWKSASIPILLIRIIASFESWMYCLSLIANE